MKCPHCTVSIHESWESKNIRWEQSKKYWVVRFMTCPACERDILQYGLGKFANARFQDPDTWAQFYPMGASRAPLSPDIPQEVAADYREAANVLPLSPKASAALSRRCLQAVLAQAGYKQKNLVDQITAVLNEKDTSRSLPASAATVLDAVRNFGNFSAHPITDQTTLQIVNVDPLEAEFCLDILDSVLDHYYVKPAEAKRRKADLDAKLKAAGKPPSR